MSSQFIKVFAYLGIGLSFLAGCAISQAHGQTVGTGVVVGDPAPQPATQLFSGVTGKSTSPRMAALSGGNRFKTTGYKPKHGRVSLVQAVSQPTTTVVTSPMSNEMIPPGEVPLMVESGQPAPCGPSGCGPVATCEPDCDPCGTQILPRCIPVCLIPVPCLSLENFTARFGTQGYTGPFNYNGQGSFGFHGGVNAGGHFPLFPDAGLGFQLGLNGTTSSLSGESYTRSSRNQLFITTGLFRRVDCGLQGGFVIDFLRDDWWGKADLLQCRYEVSWVFANCREVGFTGASHLRTRRNVTGQMLFPGFDGPAVRTQDVVFDIESTDHYTFFFRRRFGDCQENELKLFAGFSGRSDGILGGDVSVALNDSLAIETGFTYLIPKQGWENYGYAEESWNIALSLVWYPKRNARSGAVGCGTNCPYYRPLFKVADNGSMMSDLSYPPAQ